MRKYYVKSLKEYNAPIQFEKKKLIESVRTLKKSHKLPTSVALEISTIRDLKELAQRKGIPYQVLMRMLIIEGIRKLKRQAA